MTTAPTNWWRRSREGLGTWEHRGKVAIVGIGHSPTDRRWDGVSMDKTLGAYAMVAAQAALDDAGLDKSELDGMLCCPQSMAGATGGSSAVWAPRPYFDPPYDSEDGLTIVTNQWLIKNMGLTGVTYAPDDVPAIGDQMCMASEVIARGLAKYALVVYTAGNLEGRYRQGGSMQSEFAKGNDQWQTPWGRVGDMHGGCIGLQQYCTRYGTDWDDLMAPVIINQHLNGRMVPWSYYKLHEPYVLTEEDYRNSRNIAWPMHIWDNDRPINGVSAFLFTSAERAKDLKQKPVYVLNHNSGNHGGARSSTYTADELHAWASRQARMAYEGSGLSAGEIDIFNPYDGFSHFLPFYLEGYGWHGVKQGEARDFFRGDITVKGPHPFSSGGGNLGNGRTRSAMYWDSVEQLRGTAGERQVTVKAETAICFFAPSPTYAPLVLSSVPD